MLASTDPIINAFSAYKIVGLPSFLAEKYPVWIWMGEVVIFASLLHCNAVIHTSPQPAVHKSVRMLIPCWCKHELMQAATKAAAHLQALDLRQPSEVCTLVGAVTLTWLAYQVFSSALKMLLFLFQLEPPKVVVPITEDEAADVLEGCDRFDTDALKGEVRAACCRGCMRIGTHP